MKIETVNKKLFMEHIKYEIDMLIYSYQKLQEYTKERDQININIFLESFLIHARNLYEFFYTKKKKYKDDACAYDFFEKPDDWFNLIPKDIVYKDLVNNRAGKELAHLTYKRINGTPTKKGRNISNIFNDLKQTITIFLENIPKNFIEN